MVSVLTSTFCLQLKIAYSVHRDLNVKGNNERSRDYTLPEPSASYAGTPMQAGTGYGADAYMGAVNGMSSNGTNLHITGERNGLETHIDG